MCVHALHTVHALPDCVSLRDFCGTVFAIPINAVTQSSLKSAKTERETISWITGSLTFPAQQIQIGL
jgi:hypothetical protein